MKKIGAEVCMLTTDEKNPRNGEGSFIRLKDGRIMYAYTQYCGDDWTDHATARLFAIYSSDEGKSFGNGRILVERRPEQLNIMSVSLVRLPSGDLGLFYLEKTQKNGMLNCVPVFRISSDEGETFGEEIHPIAEDGCFGVVNDRVLVLSDGRVIFASEHKPPRPVDAESCHGAVAVHYSDDCGRTWKRSPEIIYSPYGDFTRFQEPGIAELADGRLWLYIRTSYGSQYQCFSTDRGESWSAPIPNWRFTTPDSPMLVRRFGDLALAIFNPVPFSCVNDRREVWGSPKRTPFVMSVSRDGGLSFIGTYYTSRDGGYDDFVANTYLLEDDPEDSYCYPATIEVDGGFLVAYYHSNGGDVCLNATRIKRIERSELC